MNPTNTKKKKILIIFAIIFLVILILFIVLKSSNKIVVSPSPVPQGGASYKNLVPGSSTLDDVFQNLGSPIKEKEEDGTRVLEYSSKNPNFNNEVSIKNESLSFVKEILTLDDNTKIPDIVNKYGDYENILYGPGAGVGFYLYVYSTKGIAYVGHQNSGLIKEIWYFPPTDFESFKQMYASDYSSTIQMIQ